MAAEFESKFAARVSPAPDALLSGAVLAFTNTTGSKSYLKALGHTDTTTGTPLAPDAVMWLASCTKIVTTIAALQCVERGLFALDAPADVARLLPELADPALLTGFAADAPVLVKPTTKITLRHLLTHTSGHARAPLHPLLKRWYAAPGNTPPLTNDSAPVATPLVFEPGTGWTYGTGFNWVGQMVVRASPGVATLGAYMQAHIFAPLGITDLTFDLAARPDMHARLMATASKVAATGAVSTEVPPSFVFPVAPAVHSGGGGLFGTAAELLKVLASLLRNDGVLLRGETVEGMFEAQLGDVAPLEAVFDDPALRGVFAPGVPKALRFNFGLGGSLALGGVEGLLGKGCLAWGGMPNLVWFVDREGGCCGVFATQLLPPGEPGCEVLKEMFQRFVFAECAAT